VTNPLGRAGSLGTQVALAPFRVLGSIAEPRRAGIRRDMRRVLGVTAEPESPVMDPERSFLHPRAVARRVHADLPAMLIGGLSALMLQTLNPLAMAGVAEHSNYKEDATGRLRRTASFVAATTYGTVDQARDAIEQVQRVHRKVRGVAPDGRRYAADDPDLVTWIHVAEVSSLLHAAQRYGPLRFSRADCDRYYEETAGVALALGADWVPRSVDEVTAYLGRVRPELYAGPQALAARDFLMRGVGRRAEDRAVYAVMVGAAVSLLPPWARAELAVPNPPLFDRVVSVPLGHALCAGLRWAVGGPGAPRPFETGPGDDGPRP